MPSTIPLRALHVLSRTPSADNSQPWRFAVSPGSFRCSYGIRPGHRDPFGPTGHASLVAGGAMHESLAVLNGGADDAAQCRVEITAAGWSIAQVPAAPGGADTPEPPGLIERHTNRHPYEPTPVAWAPAPRSWPAGSRIALTADPAAIAAIAAAVQLCSEVRFNTQELHEWLFSSIRWSDNEAAAGDGLDVASLHLPPGGRQFMKFLAPWSRMAALNKLGLHRIMASIDAKLVADAPAILALTGGSAPAQAWEAGRAMMDAWVSLNAAGYAVHPYYVVTDIATRLDAGLVAPQWQRDAKRAAGLMRDALALQQGERVHLLFRVGRPTRSPVRSRRLALDQLMIASD